MIVNADVQRVVVVVVVVGFSVLKSIVADVVQHVNQTSARAEVIF
jgi:hypothetical protein